MIPAIYVILGALVGCIILVFYFLNTRINTIFVKLDEMTNKSPKKTKQLSKQKPPKLDSPICTITYFSDAVATVDTGKYEDLTQTEIQEIKKVEIEDEIDEEVNEIIEQISD